jgi:outer membrane protein assembly factor BamB
MGVLAGPVSRADCDPSWTTYGHDLGRSMSQDCTSISLTNVSTLHPKWIFNTGAPVTAQPAVADNTVYVGAANGTFYALPADAAGTPEPRWTFTVTDQNQDSYGKFVSSPALADVGGTKVVVVGGGATLYVLDAATGKQLASRCFDYRTDPSVACKGSDHIIEIESSPAVIAHGNSADIYVGMDYNEGGPGRAGMVRLTLARAEDAWSLTPEWKFDPEALVAYHDDVFAAGGPGDGCGNTWSSPTVDRAAGLVYFDISNCETGRHHADRYGGESAFAIDAETGALAWCYSPRPINNDDLDFGATPNLLPGNRVGFGGKDGAYYSFPRAATSAPVTDVTTACRGANAHAPNWSTTVATGGAIDGIIGTPALGKVSDPLGGARDAVFATNAIPMPDQDTFSNPQRLTTLHAIDAATGEVIWDAPNVFPAYAGPVYAKGIVFMPDTFGMNFTAYSADAGVPVWSFPMFAPSGPPAISGDSIYIGSGVAPAPGTPALSDVGAVYAFQTAPTP